MLFGKTLFDKLKEREQTSANSVEILNGDLACEANFSWLKINEHPLPTLAMKAGG